MEEELWAIDQAENSAVGKVGSYCVLIITLPAPTPLTTLCRDCFYSQLRRETLTEQNLLRRFKLCTNKIRVLQEENRQLRQFSRFDLYHGWQRALFT